MIIPLADDEHIVQIVNEPPYENGFYYIDEASTYCGPFHNDEEAYTEYKALCDKLNTKEL